MLIKFKDAGKWADKPADPIFEVKAGQVVEVSESLGEIVINAGKGSHVTTPPPIKEKVNPAAEDKSKADKGSGFLNKSKKKKKKSGRK